MNKTENELSGNVQDKLTDLQEYTKHAVRTEGLIDEVRTNEYVLRSTLALIIAAAEMLDAIKKSVFYGNDQKYLTDLPKRVSDIQKFGTSIQSFLEVQGIEDMCNNKTLISLDPRIFHGIIGVATEGGELCEAVEAALVGGEFDEVNVREELFDTAFYTLLGFDATGGNPDDALERGFEKLRQRYGETFNEEGANNRDLEKEREILEGVKEIQNG